MFGLGPQEIMVILVILLLLFGGKKLPELSRSLGKSKREFEEGLSEEKEVEQVEEEKEYTSPEVLKIAKNMGIETEGKSEKEILKAIEAKSS